MTAPLVWLPFDPDLLADPPEGLRYEVVDSTEGVPDTVDEVEFYVPPYSMGSSAAGILPRATSLRVVQTLTAGVDNVRAAIPQGVTLCSGRGIHDTSTAELALTLVLAAMRGVPEFVRAHDRHEWAPRWRPALADKQVLLVGYGAIGRAIEARLLPFETEVVRVARRARPGVHPIDDLPDLLPTADVVILVVPLTDATRGLVDAGLLGLMKDGALLVNVARGGVVVQDDLMAELAGGRLHAAIDVMEPEPLPEDSPLWSVPNLLVSPHVGGMSSAMWPRAHRLVRDQLHRFANGAELANVLTGEY